MGTVVPCGAIVQRGRVDDLIRGGMPYPIIRGLDRLRTTPIVGFRWPGAGHFCCVTMSW